MKKYTKGKNQISVETQDEALKIARSIQKQGQTKEQTKLISQGIQKGIDQYKKQHKAKARELNKQLKKAKNIDQSDLEGEVTESIVFRERRLPWLLLIMSWVFFIAYFLF
jgi:osmotically-inducible protein OsmY